jgi:hypothetical protein
VKSWLVLAFRPSPPVLGVDAVHLVLDDDLALLLHEGAKLLQELAVALGLVLELAEVVDLPAPQAVAHHLELRTDLLLELLLLVDEREVGGDVLRAEGPRALEHHVFEEVAEAGDARSLVGRAHPRHPACGHGGRLVALEKQETHAISEGQLFDLDARALHRGEKRVRDEDEGQGGGRAGQSHAGPFGKGKTRRSLAGSM